MPASIVCFSVVPYPYLIHIKHGVRTISLCLFLYFRMSVESLNALVLSFEYRANQTEPLPHYSLFCVQLAICTKRSCDNVFIKMKLI